MVLRRTANAARTSERVAGSGAGAMRRRPTRAESTRGRGENTSRPTVRRPVDRHASCTTTDGPPYSRVPGGASQRSATSRWVISAQSVTPGRRQMVSISTGVATWYGRLLTTFVGGGSSASRSTFMQSPQWMCTPGSPAVDSASGSCMRGSTSSA